MGASRLQGRIDRVKFQSSSSVWGYFSISNKGGIHEFADSQFGHLFASAPDREQARKALVLALKELDVRGEIRNPVEYLVKLLETDDFKKNTIDTAWLDGIIKNRSISPSVGGSEDDKNIVVLSSAVFRAHQLVKTELAAFEDSLSKGQTSVADLKTINSFQQEIVYGGTKYLFNVARSSPDRFTLSINGNSVDIKIREQADGSLLCNFGGTVRKIFGQEEPLGLRMVIDGSTVMLPNVFDPSELRSDVTGKVVRFLQEEGTEVPAGTPFVECEAMKMIMQLRTTEAGTIKHNLSPGSIINAGDLLATMELKDPSKVAKIESYTGDMKVESGAANLDPMHLLDLALQGYPSTEIGSLVSRLLIDQDADTATEKIITLLNGYLATEESFKNKALDQATLELITANKDNIKNVVAAVQSHAALKTKNELVLSLLRNDPTRRVQPPPKAAVTARTVAQHDARRVRCHAHAHIAAVRHVEGTVLHVQPTAPQRLNRRARVCKCRVT